MRFSIVSFQTIVVTPPGVSANMVPALTVSAIVTMATVARVVICPMRTSANTGRVTSSGIVQILWGPSSAPVGKAILEMDTIAKILTSVKIRNSQAGNYYLLR